MLIFVWYPYHVQISVHQVWTQWPDLWGCLTLGASYPLINVNWHLLGPSYTHPPSFISVEPTISEKIDGQTDSITDICQYRLSIDYLIPYVSYWERRMWYRYFSREIMLWNSFKNNYFWFLKSWISSNKYHNAMTTVNIYIWKAIWTTNISETQEAINNQSYRTPYKHAILLLPALVRSFQYVATYFLYDWIS